MSTQSVAVTPTNSHAKFPPPSLRPQKYGRGRRATLRRTEDLWERICAYNDASTVRDLRVLHSYLGEFLAMPESILEEWERS